MKRVSWYVLREMIAPLLVGVFLYGGILLFGHFYIGAPYLTGKEPLMILQWMSYNIPDTLVRVFPMAIVLMVLISFGRMTTEHELIAMRSAGISTLRIAMPPVVLAFLVFVFSVVLTEYTVPYANSQSRAFWWDQLQTPGQGIHRLSGKTIPINAQIEMRFEEYDFSTSEMVNVRIQKWENQTGLIILAPRGRYEGSEVILKEAKMYQIDYGRIGELQKAFSSNDLKQIQDAFPNVFKLVNIVAGETTIKTSLSQQEAIGAFADPLASDTSSISASYRESLDPKLSQMERDEARKDFHFKLAVSAANLVLVLVSLPFAMKYGRSTGVAMGISVAIVLVYYVSLMLAQAIAGMGFLPSGLVIWFPNVIFCLLGWRMLRN